LHAFDGVCKQLEILSSTVPGANIVDSCSSFPPPPPPPPPTGSCPTPAGNQTTTSFNLSEIAWAASGGDRSAASLMIDVQWSVVDVDEFKKWTSPDLDLAALPGKSNLKVNAGCKYSVDYTVFCGAPQSDADFQNGTAPRDIASICQPPQVNEGFRANFYSARDPSDPGQCDRRPQFLRAYFDAPDHFVGAVSSAEVSISGVPVTSSTGDIVCMEMVSGCEQSTSHVGCNPGDPNYNHNASIYLHSFDWIEEPV